MTDINITTGVGNTVTYSVPDPDGGINTTDGYEHSDYWYDYNRNDPDRENPFTNIEDWVRAESVVGSGKTASDYPSSFNTFSVNDDQIAHHVPSYEELNLNIHANSPYNDGWTQQAAKEELAKMTDSRNKYHEKEILKDIEDYVSGTYNGHYTGTKHEVS